MDKVVSKADKDHESHRCTITSYNAVPQPGTLTITITIIILFTFLSYSISQEITNGSLASRLRPLPTEHGLAWISYPIHPCIHPSLHALYIHALYILLWTNPQTHNLGTRKVKCVACPRLGHAVGPRMFIGGRSSFNTIHIVKAN